MFEVTDVLGHNIRAREWHSSIPSCVAYFSRETVFRYFRLFCSAEEKQKILLFMLAMGRLQCPVQNVSHMFSTFASSFGLKVFQARSRSPHSGALTLDVPRLLCLCSPGTVGCKQVIRQCRGTL